MIGPVVLLGILSLPIVVWAIVHHRPTPKVRSKDPHPGPKHRWWQP
jgi:hypothetical protein